MYIVLLLGNIHNFDATRRDDLVQYSCSCHIAHTCLLEIDQLHSALILYHFPLCSPDGYRWKVQGHRPGHVWTLNRKAGPEGGRSAASPGMVLECCLALDSSARAAAGLEPNWPRTTAVHADPQYLFIFSFSRDLCTAIVFRGFAYCRGREFCGSSLVKEKKRCRG